MFAFIADTHFRGRDLEQKRRVCSQITQQVKERGVRWVFILGDLFHKGKIYDNHASTGKICSVVREWFDAMGLPVIILEGNHDQYLEGDSAFETFSHPSTLVIRNRVAHIRLDNDYFICIPWLRESRIGHNPKTFVAKEIKRLYAEIRAENANAPIHILGHCDAVGTEINSITRISSTDYSYFTFDFTKLCEGMNISSVLLGHIHERQGFKIPKGVFGSYIGYPMCMGHGEEQHATGWLHLDYQDGKAQWSFVDVESPRYYQFLASEESDYLEKVKEGDFIRVLGTPSLRFSTENIEILPDTIDRKAVDKYIENKNSSFREVFEEWAKLTEISVPNHPLISDYLNRIGVQWEEMSGKFHKLTRVELKGVGPHEDRVIDFSSGMTVIVGENGSGKSLLLEALPAACYGKWPSPSRGSAQGVFTNPKSSMSVEFRVEDTSYKVVRTQNTLDVYDSDGNALCGPLKGDSEAFLSRIMGSKESFLQSCFCDQQGKHDLIECSSNERMEVLREHLKLNVFDEYLKEVKERKAILESSMHDIEELYEERDSILSDISACNAKIVGYIANIEKQKNRISQLKCSLDSAWKELQSFSEQKNRWDNIKTLRDEVSHYKQVLDDLKVARLNLSDREEEYPTERLRELSIQQDRRNSLLRTKKRLEDSTSLLDRAGCGPNFLPCPLIDAAVGQKKELLDVIEKLGKIDSEFPDLDNQILNLERLVKEWETHNRERIQLDTRIQDMTDIIIRKEKAINNLDVIILDHGGYDLTLKYDYELLESETRQCNAIIAKASGDLGKEQARLAVCEKKLHTVDEKLSKAQEQEEEHKTLTLLSFAFSRSGISHYLASSALPELQEILDSLLQRAFPSYRVAFENVVQKGSKTSEGFVIRFFDKSGRGYDARSCSPGEKAVIRFLWKMVLILYHRRRNQTYKVLFLDEPTAAMHVSNAENVFKTLEYFKDMFRQILLVTHDDSLVQMADQVIRID